MDVVLVSHGCLQVSVGLEGCGLAGLLDRDPASRAARSYILALRREDEMLRNGLFLTNVARPRYQR
jgi:hypothetical protein